MDVTPRQPPCKEFRRGWSDLWTTPGPFRTNMTCIIDPRIRRICQRISSVRHFWTFLLTFFLPQTRELWLSFIIINSKYIKENHLICQYKDNCIVLDKSPFDMKLVTLSRIKFVLKLNRNSKYQRISCFQFLQPFQFSLSAPRRCRRRRGWGWGWGRFGSPSLLHVARTFSWEPVVSWPRSREVLECSRVWKGAIPGTFVTWTLTYTSDTVEFWSMSAFRREVRVGESSVCLLGSALHPFPWRSILTERKVSDVGLELFRPVDWSGRGWYVLLKRKIL